MIFVDTSVWVAAFRAGHGKEAQHLRALLDTDAVALAVPVQIEILAGASRTDRVRLRRLLSALPVFHPTTSTWHLIDGWIDVAGDAGQRFGFADLLIGAIASEQRSAVWSLDGDFMRLEKLGLVETHGSG